MKNFKNGNEVVRYIEANNNNFFDKIGDYTAEGQMSTKQAISRKFDNLINLVNNNKVIISNIVKRYNMNTFLKTPNEEFITKGVIQKIKDKIHDN